MGFLYFVRFETEQLFWRKRWLLPLPIMLFISYIMISGVLIQASNYALQVNAWDALFSVFGSGNILFFVVTVLFLYLVSDLPLESGFGQAILLRLGSRRLWWLGKILTLGLAVVGYLIVDVGIVASVASFALPWQSAWSEGGRQMPLEFSIAPPAVSMSPFFAFGQLVLLLALGWFCLGLLLMVVGQRARHALAGFTASTFVNLSGLMTFKADVPPPYSYLFIHQHLLFDYHSFGDAASPYPPFIASVLYWLVWIVLLSALGLRLAWRQDFLRHEQQE